MVAEENRVSEITRVDMPTWDRYDKLWCLRALWDPAEYQSFRESQLKIPRDIMARWPNWPEAIQDNQERIHWILTHTPDGPTVPETEPTGLSRLAYHCIETLKHILEHHSMLADSQKVNILAALEAYRSGSLDPKPGDVTYWYAGVLKEDPGPQGSQSYAEAMDRWGQEHGETTLWIEPVYIISILIDLLFSFFTPSVAVVPTSRQSHVGEFERD
ncbi:hypothetical protein DTO217A2_6956 [Paecilomyces variotii]|nr:hypothetical protein DTO217A2_6956 [Paecilomyces variotii]